MRQALIIVLVLLRYPAPTISQTVPPEIVLTVIETVGVSRPNMEFMPLGKI